MSINSNNSNSYSKLENILIIGKNKIRNYAVGGVIPKTNHNHKKQWQNKKCCNGDHKRQREQGRAVFF